MRENTDTSSTTTWKALSKAINADATAAGTAAAGTVDVDLADLDRVVDYHRGRLDAHATSQLQQRLATSPALVAELLDLQAFTVTAAEGPDASHQDGVDVAGAWASFEAQLDRGRAETHETAHQAPAVVVDLAARRRLPRPTRAWWVAAAAAVLAIIGLRTLGPDTPASVKQHAVGVMASFESGAPDSGWTVVTRHATPASSTSVETGLEAPTVDATGNTSAPTPANGNLLLDADFETQDDWHIHDGSA